jgi:hypothetical protein
VVTNARNDLVQIGMSERLTARNGDDAGAEAGKMIDAAQHLVQRHGLGDLVVLVAIGAGEIAEAHGDDLRHDDVVGRGQRVSDDAELPQLAGGGLHPALAAGDGEGWSCGGGGHSGWFDYIGRAGTSIWQTRAFVCSGQQLGPTAGLVLVRRQTSDDCSISIQEFKDCPVNFESRGLAEYRDEWNDVLVNATDYQSVRT